MESIARADKRGKGDSTSYRELDDAEDENETLIRWGGEEEEGGKKGKSSNRKNGEVKGKQKERGGRVKTGFDANESMLLHAARIVFVAPNRDANSE